MGGFLEKSQVQKQTFNLLITMSIDVFSSGGNILLDHPEVVSLLQIILGPFSHQKLALAQVPKLRMILRVNMLIRHKICSPVEVANLGI